MLMLGLIEARGIVVQRVKRELVVATEGFDISSFRMLSWQLEATVPRDDRQPEEIFEAVL